MRPLLRVEGVTLDYETNGVRTTAVQDVSFDVSPSDRFILLGPSGCGKSTLLKAAGGFLRPAAGRILLQEARITAPGPDRVLVFQEMDQLLPWKTVEENVVFALAASGRMRGAEARERARQALAKVNLSDVAASYPHTLSGGMKQRAAIARAMAMEPRILLMDEPFAALDALTRNKMQEELLRLWEDTKFTMLFVTHSIPEALRVGNRILLLSARPGRVLAEVESSGTDAAAIHRMLFGKEDDKGHV
jgi:NitT/TauT family transport system ATP-binding protein